MNTAATNKSILILFTDEWISYSPSILNLMKHLGEREGVRVDLICFDSGRYPLNKSTLNVKTHIIRISPLFLGLLSILKLHRLYKRKLIQKKASDLSFDHIIGVDLLGVQAGLWLSKKVHMFSLEVEKSSIFTTPSHQGIASVTIQSEERYRYLFGRQKKRVYYVQNAPDFNEHLSFPTYHPQLPVQLICFGNLIPRHGVFQCIECLFHAKRAVLTLAGRIPEKVKAKIINRYNDLIVNEKLLLNDAYTPQEDVVKYLTKFHIGLCFYDFKQIKKCDFNYLSSPSGKLFNYYAAGLPVIASDISGLKSVVEYGSGVLIKTVDGKTIKTAIDTIINDYPSYQSKAIKAAKAFDFSKSIKPFVDFVLGQANRKK